MKNSLLIVFACFSFFSCEKPEQKSVSPLTEEEIKLITAAKKFDDLFILDDKIELTGGNDSCFVGISDIKIANNGDFIIPDGWNTEKVFVFDKSGKFKNLIGRKGKGPGEFITPVSVAVNKENDVFILDYDHSQILQFNRQYKFIKNIKSNDQSYFLHINSNSDFYLYNGIAVHWTNSIFNSINKLNKKGSKITSFAPTPKEAFSAKTVIIQNSMRIDAKDYIYEMNTLYYNIRKFDPSGKLIKEFGKRTNNQVENKNVRAKYFFGPFLINNKIVAIEVDEKLNFFDSEGNFLIGGIKLEHKILFTNGNNLYFNFTDSKTDNHYFLKYAFKTFCKIETPKKFINFGNSIETKKFIYFPAILSSAASQVN